MVGGAAVQAPRVIGDGRRCAAVYRVYAEVIIGQAGMIYIVSPVIAGARRVSGPVADLTDLVTDRSWCG